MMKRLVILATLIVIAAGSLNAHWFYDMYRMRYRRPYFGMRINGGISYPYRVRWARTPVSNRAIGHEFGLSGLFHAPVCRSFYWQPELEVYCAALKTRGKLSDMVLDEGITEATFKTIGSKASIALGFDFKVGPKLHKRFDIFIFTGPEFDFRFKTQFTVNHPTESDMFDITMARSLYGDYGVDLGLRSGLGFRFKNIYIGGYFTWKLCYLTKSDFGAKRQRIGGVSLGYCFKTL